MHAGKLSILANGKITGAHSNRIELGNYKPGMIKKILAQHQRIFESVKKQNVADAEKAMAEQMNYLCEQYAQAQEWRRDRDEESQ